MVILLPSRRPAARPLKRRELLRIGAASALGLSLTDLLQAEGTANRATGTARNCIYIFLCGGPSQLDMWDPKPDAPEGIRSPFQPLQTNAEGIHFTELLPRTARHADKLAIIRSMRHDNSSHAAGIAYTLLATGNPPSKQAFPPTREDHPAIGGALDYLLGTPSELPSWVILPRVFTTGSNYFKGQTAGFLGPAHDPFALTEPKLDSLADREFRIGSLSPPQDVSSARQNARRDLLERIDRLSSSGVESPGMARVRHYREQALSMVSTDRGKRAFNLEAEPARLRERYGRNEYGQSFLLSRRLVESGVRMVNLFWTYYGKDGCQFNLWDNHGIDGPVCGGYRTGFDMIQAPYCCPSFDQAFSALIEDLDLRGLLKETLVVVVGEFGRTPKINKTAGRDHWPNCYSAVLAGGGVQGGQVYGSSDSHAAYVQDAPVSPDDFGATIFHAFGVPPETLIYDGLDRPLPVSRGKPVTAIF